MLSPKRTKYRKYHRGRMRGKAIKGNEICFGNFGLQALEDSVLRGLHYDQYISLMENSIELERISRNILIDVIKGGPSSFIVKSVKLL